MQKGEAYRNGLGRAAMILMFALVLFQGRCRAADSWARGMGGVVFPGRDHPAAFDISGGYLFATVSAANPFSVPGLYRSTASISLVCDRWAAGFQWERTGITGYSHNHLGASGGLVLPGGFVDLTGTVRADSRRVEGYGRDTAVSIAFSLSLELSSVLALEMEACGRSGEEPVLAAIRVGRRDIFLVLTLGRNSRHENIARAGGSISIARRLAFLAGYDLETGEVSGGLTVRSGIPAAFSWSSHPVLGSTISVSVGALR